nr:MAG TPA: hypothetical protein [Caudoviricetes sp.]
MQNGWMYIIRLMSFGKTQKLKMLISLLMLILAN